VQILLYFLFTVKIAPQGHYYEVCGSKRRLFYDLPLFEYVIFY